MTDGRAVGLTGQTLIPAPLDNLVPPLRDAAGTSVDGLVVALVTAFDLGGGIAATCAVDVCLSGWAVGVFGTDGLAPDVLTESVAWVALAGTAPVGEVMLGVGEEGGRDAAE